MIFTPTPPVAEGAESTERGGGEIKELHAAVPMRARREAAGTWATPSSQPRITSCLPITNLKGLFLSREESNFFPSSSIPGERKEGGKGGGEG